MNIICIIATLLFAFGVIFTSIRKQYMITLLISMGALVTYYWCHKEPKKENLILVVSPDYMPYCYMDSGKVKGIDISLMQDVAKIMNKKLEIKTIGFNFLFNHLKQNKSHVGASGLSITEEREKNCDFSMPYVPTLCGVLYKNNIQIHRDFNGTIGVQNGSIFVKIAKEKFPAATIVEVEDFMVLVESLKSRNNKMHAIIGDTIVLLQFFGKNSKEFTIKKIHIHDHNINRGTGFAINKNNIDVEEFNVALVQAIKKNKHLLDLMDQVHHLQEMD